MSGGPDLIEAIASHIQHRVGRIATVFHEIVSDDLQIEGHGSAPPTPSAGVSRPRPGRTSGAPSSGCMARLSGAMRIPAPGTLLVSAALALCAPPAAACDPPWLPISRPAGGAFFVAVAAGAAADGVHAQLVAGGGVPEAREPGSVHLVPWAYAPDCQPLAWDPQAVWPVPTEPAFYTGRLRPREGWLDGRPTFDVHMAWREPLWRAGDPRWTHAAPGEVLLTPREFLELYAALPTHDELRADPRAAAHRTRLWAATHRALAEREPARTILGNLSRAAEASQPRAPGAP